MAISGGRSCGQAAEDGENSGSRLEEQSREPEAELRAGREAGNVCVTEFSAKQRLIFHVKVPIIQNETDGGMHSLCSNYKHFLFGSSIHMAVLVSPS